MFRTKAEKVYFFFGKIKYYINKIFEKSELLVAYKPQCSINQLLKLKFSINDGNKFQGIGIYQLICGDCGKKYKGQTGRNFEKVIKITYTHLGVKNTTTKFSGHVLEKSHAIRRTDYLMAVRHYI